MQNESEKSKMQLHAEVFADGPTRVLRLTDTNTHRPSISHLNVVSPVSNQFQSITDSIQVSHRNANLDVSLDLAGLGISVINSLPQVPEIAPRI
jgi:hypothetical protein